MWLQRLVGCELVEHSAIHVRRCSDAEPRQNCWSEIKDARPLEYQARPNTRTNDRHECVGSVVARVIGRNSVSGMLTSQQPPTLRGKLSRHACLGIPTD